MHVFDGVSRNPASLVPTLPGRNVAFGPIVPEPKRFVYILQSIRAVHEYYVGVTSDPERRLAWHNAGLCRYTSRHHPWKKLVVVEFDTEEPALAFERYLKTGSGREFARRHFRQTSRRADSSHLS